MFLGLIGTGTISDTHARAAREAGLALSAVCGRSLDRARRLTEAYGGVPYDSLETFLAHRPLDVVAVASPSGHHAAHALAAVRQGLHVIVEKPIDISVERADALIAEARRAGVRLAVCYQERFAPDLVRVKDLIDRGELGRLLLADARVPWYRPPSYYSGSTWRGTLALDGGGALINQGSHTVDVLLWLAGDVARVTAMTATARHRIEAEDTALALLEFASGALGSIAVTTAVYPGFARRIMIAGATGTLTIERETLVGADFVHGRSDIAVTAPSEGDARSSSPVVADVSNHRAAYDDLIRAITTGGRPCCDGREGRRSLAVIRAIYESAAERRPVDVRPESS